MNKLDVALSLFRLLNERKSINARLVAEKLNVSIRTAQRYLLELSAQPCVVVDEMKHTFSLNPEYPIKHALFSQPDPKQPVRDIQQKALRGSVPTSIFCLTCGQTRNCFPELHLLLNHDGATRNARQEFNRLVSLIKKRLKEGKCGFP